MAGETHLQVKITQQAAQDVMHAVLPGDREAVYVRTADQHRVGTQRERLGDVGPAADPAVEQDGQPASGVHHGWQRIQRRDGPVDQCRPASPRKWERRLFAEPIIMLCSPSA